MKFFWGDQTDCQKGGRPIWKKSERARLRQSAILDVWSHRERNALPTSRRETNDEPAVGKHSRADDAASNSPASIAVSAQFWTRSKRGALYPNDCSTLQPGWQRTPSAAVAVRATLDPPTDRTEEKQCQCCWLWPTPWISCSQVGHWRPRSVVVADEQQVVASTPICQALRRGLRVLRACPLLQQDEEWTGWRHWAAGGFWTRCEKEAR